MDKFVAGSWGELESHQSESSPLPDLHAVVNHTWHQLRAVCPTLPEHIDVDIEYDKSMVGKHVLGYASRTMFLKDNMWISSMKFPWYAKTDVLIRINPGVPNGWHSSLDGTCNIGWRYDLNTVVMHELLHGAGITSSITSDSVGYTSGSSGSSGSSGCYPTLMDTKIQDRYGHVVDGCNMRRSDHYHIDGVSLYTPKHHNPGSSFSHHNMIGHPMYYNLPARKCLNIGRYETALLTALGETCVDVDFHIGSNGSNGYNGSTPYALLLFLLVVWLRI